MIIAGKTYVLLFKIFSGENFLYILLLYIKLRIDTNREIFPKTLYTYYNVRELQ